MKSKSFEQRLEEHANSFNNPHGLIREHLHLENIKDKPLATMDQAYQGDVRGKHMTPLRLKEMFRGLLVRGGYIDEQGNPLI